MGPEGPAGPQGATGPQGPAGIDATPQLAFLITNEGDVLRGGDVPGFSYERISTGRYQLTFADDGHANWPVPTVNPLPIFFTPAFATINGITHVNGTWTIEIQLFDAQGAHVDHGVAINVTL
jgi:hypothetical protein